MTHLIFATLIVNNQNWINNIPLPTGNFEILDFEDSRIPVEPRDRIIYLTYTNTQKERIHIKIQEYNRNVVENPFFVSDNFQNGDKTMPSKIPFAIGGRIVNDENKQLTLQWYSNTTAVSIVIYGKQEQRKGHALTRTEIDTESYLPKSESIARWCMAHFEAENMLQQGQNVTLYGKSYVTQKFKNSSINYIRAEAISSNNNWEYSYGQNGTTMQIKTESKTIILPAGALKYKVNSTWKELQQPILMKGGQIYAPTECF